MNVFDKIMEEQKDLLQAKGYNESSIHSAAPEGKFLKRLENNLTHAIKYADRFKETYEFEIKTAGVFYDEKNVLFTFEFEYDPYSEKLQIKSLLALAGEQEHQYILKQNTDLPCAEEVFHKLITMENKMEEARKLAQVRGELKGQKI